MRSNSFGVRRSKAWPLLLLLMQAGWVAAETENRSWHFYNEQLPIKEQKKHPKPPKKIEKPKEQKPDETVPDKTVTVELQPETSSDSEAKSPPIGSSAWLKEHLPKIRELAMDNPTRDNVRLYAYFERVAFDKADRFSTVYERVQKTSPMLNEDMRRPTSMRARSIIGNKIREGIDDATRQILKNNALVFFFKRDCDLCEAMASELSLIKRRYGATILPVSMEGEPLQSGLFPEFKVDQGQAELIGIPTYPAVVVYETSNNAWVPVNYGFKGRGALMTTLIEFGLEREWISKAQYDATKTTTYNHLIEVPIKESELPEVPKEYVDLFETLVQRNAHE